MSEALWHPTPERIASAHLTRFTEHVNARYGSALRDYRALYDWSLREPGAFWSELAAFAQVRADWGSGPVLVDAGRMPGAQFFPHARLSFTDNLLRDRDEHAALVFRNERGARRVLSYGQLTDDVARIAAGLADAGVVAGDRVAGFLPNLPEAIVAMLAAASLGAIWTSCSPDFGAQGVLDRFGQIAPKVLFVADGYFYNGKTIDSLATTREVAAMLPSLARLVVIPYVSEQPGRARLAAAPRPATAWSEFGMPGAPLRCASLPFNHPLYILYSSGTTGAPKCIVHGAGGTLLQHQKEHLLHTDMRREDCVFYFTTCGWMMWNWLASALATGATLVLYDGSPFHPDAGALWRMAQEERITVFGTSAKYLSALEKSGFAPARATDLTALRTVLSTGSPLLPDSFDYVYREVKSDLQLASISGGTDIVSCFALGCPTRPVYRGEIQCRGLGMAVAVYDDAGHPLQGARGELVCTAPFPSMPLGFWNDADGRKYRAAYFERFPGIWHHGDYAALTAHDGLVIYGRSDAVLNPGGVRIGTAELYAAVETLDEVVEALAIGQDWRDDVRVVLFVRLRPGITLDEMLRGRIRAAIRARTTPRHVPAKIVAVTDLPRTLSGKLSELAVRNVIHGRAVVNADALANPQALEQFRDLPELASD
ncbi:MAG TPA: acetoacetate--CoA ligase [Steroidobacteraceae bacterium]|nr:acetoacetate--CoA ligase [Steroidobacteraceae bacterium]